MNRERCLQQYYGDEKRIASLSGWHSSTGKREDIDSITISAINKEEAVKFVKNNYPRFKYYQTHFKASGQRLGGYTFKRNR